MSNWIVELEPGVFLADGDGDPPRSLSNENAAVFSSHPRARIALMNAQKHRPFAGASVTLAPLQLPPNAEFSGRGATDQQET